MSGDEPSIYFPPGGKDYGRNKYTGRRFHPPWASGQFETPGEKRAFIHILHGHILSQARFGHSDSPQLEELEHARSADLAKLLEGYGWKQEINRQLGREAFRDIKLVDEKTIMDSLREWASLTPDEYDRVYTYLREIEAEINERKRVAYREAAEKGWVPKPVETVV